MSDRELEKPHPARVLRAKYGNAKLQTAIHRAIRAELIGGDHCMDAMTAAHQLARKLRQRDLPGADDAEAALAALIRVANEMEAEIRRRYGITVPERIEQ